MDTSSTNTPRQTDRRGFFKLAAGAASIPLAAACGGGGGALGGGTGSKGKVTQITVPINKSPWLPAFQKLAAEYEKKTDIQVTLREFPYEGMKTAMTNAIQGGNDPFDVYVLDEPWTGQFYSRGWVTPLSDVDPDYAWDPQVIDYDLLPRWDATSKTAKAGGDVMGLPINGNVNLFVYRKDVYDALGLAPPKTFDDVARNGRKAQQSGKAKYGYVVRAEATTTGQSVTYDFMPLLYTYGGDWFDDDWASTIGDAPAVEAMTMFKTLAGLGPPQPHTVGQSDVIAAMQSGQAAQCHTVAAAASQLLDPEKSDVADKIGFAVMPTGSTGKPTPTSGVWTMAVPAGLTKNRRTAAYKFITWVQSKSAQLTFTREGGIPTRKDTYDASGLPKNARPYLDVIAEGIGDVRQSVRFPFAADMLPPAERTMAAIASGKQPVKDGLGALAKTLTKAANDAGYGR